jgi:hypothetical protein
MMLQTMSRVVLEILLFCGTAGATHYFMSFTQTVMHRTLGHHPIGMNLFRNHLNFHHTYYCVEHLISQCYRGNEGNNTPFFFIPVGFIGLGALFILPLYLLVGFVVGCSASLYMHVFIDKQYHVEGSRLGRFNWFRRKQELHSVHHRYGNCNFAVIDFFWDRLLGSYRGTVE